MTTATLTREQILATPAGRKLDAHVGAFMLGGEAAYNMAFETEDERFWSVLVGPRAGTGWSTPLPYSTDIAAAWQVVEKMQADGDVDIFIEWWRDGEWFVGLRPFSNHNENRGAACDGKKTSKPSAPLAICRAALLAVMDKP